jgi:Holliday junction DNA helicase RuvB
MAYYDLEDLTEIIERTADIFEADITGDGVMKWRVGAVGHHVSPTALKRVRDYAQIKGTGLIDDDITRQALTMLDVDASGLDYVDQKNSENDD